jgi:Lon protease-like protein
MNTLPIDELPPDVPDTVPVFPLPDHVFLPASPTPYRIFEPRYRELVTFLLALPPARRWLAIPRLAPGYESDYEGRPPFHEIATVGRMAECLENADGTFHVIVGEGVRCRVREVRSPHAFRLARWTAHPDVAVAAVDPALVYDALLQLIGALARALGRPARGLLALAGEEGTRAQRVSRFANVLLQHPGARQEFLECLDESRRIDLVMGAAVAILSAAGGTAGPPS